MKKITSTAQPMHMRKCLSGCEYVLATDAKVLTRKSFINYFQSEGLLRSGTTPRLKDAFLGTNSTLSAAISVDRPRTAEHLKLWAKRLSLLGKPCASASAWVWVKKSLTAFTGLAKRKNKSLNQSPHQINGRHHRPTPYDHSFLTHFKS